MKSQQLAHYTVVAFLSASCFLPVVVYSTTSSGGLTFGVSDDTLQLEGSAGDENGADDVTLDFNEKMALPDKSALTFRYQVNDETNFSFAENTHIVEPLKNLTLSAKDFHYAVGLTPKLAGVVVLSVWSDDPLFVNISFDDLYVRVSVVHFKWMTVMSAVIGWIYFAAWSVSFYPQASCFSVCRGGLLEIVENFRRKSVVGLNFDFVTYNLVGFICYSAFNCAMFWDTETIQKEYFAKHVRGLLPVEVNDVVFALHAVAITAFTGFQCLIYERGGQRISWVCLAVCSLILAFLAVTSILAATDTLVHTWLDFLYLVSYVKIFITLVKYMPQAWMNYRRKSTVGWSIGNILLDCTGGSFSILQMFLDAYNHNDWASIFGNPTKFSLGAISICFDILFILQHYVFYRRGKVDYIRIESGDDETVQREGRRQGHGYDST